MLSSRIILSASAVGLVSLLTACGGSSNVQLSTTSNSTFLDSGTTLTYSSSSALSALQDSEFLRLNGTGANSTLSPYESVNIHEAYGYGVSGNGQTINIMDSSFDTSHQEISGKTTSFGTIGSATSNSYHGLAVASIAAGKKDASGIHGVAYNANLHITDYTYYGAETYLPDQWANLTNDAANNHQAIAQNNSWGVNVTLTDVKSSAQTNNWNNAQAVAFELDIAGYDANESSVNNYVQALNNFQSHGVIVYALSNSHSFNEADFQAALPELFPQLAEAWITTTDIEVTGSSSNISYTRQSAKCGSTAAYCLGADGTEIVTAKHSPSSTTDLDDSVYGTSFTAPQVSGALALLAEAFPNHSPEQLVDRLLASANNDFFTATGYTTFINGVQHGYNSEFGHGMMDLGSAMLPIINTGSPRMVTGTSLQSGRQYQASNSRLQVSTGFGDSITNALSDKQVYIYDDLNGGFAYPLVNIISTANSSTKDNLLQHLDYSKSIAASTSFNHLSTPYNVNSSWQLKQPVGMAGLHTNISSSTTDASMPRVSIIWQSPNYLPTQAQVETGLHHSTAALLGLQGSGAFNLQGATGRSSFTNFSVRHKPAANWQFDLQASAAISQLNTPQDSLIEGFENVISNAYNLSATRKKLFFQDQLSLHITQPHRVNSGLLKLNIADLAHANGDIKQQTQGLPLATSGQQTDLLLSYQLWLNNNVRLGLQHQSSLEPNHIASAATKQQQTVSLQGDVFSAALGYDANQHQPSILLRWQGDM